MKKTMKRLLAVILVIVSVCTAVSPVFSAATVNDLPIVYVAGKNTFIYNTSGKKIYPTGDLSAAIDAKKGDLVKAWAKSLLTNDWTPLSDAIYDLVVEQYNEFTPNDNGNVTNGTTIKPVKDPVVKKSNFRLEDYVFTYDSRLDPYENTAKLNEYINAVLAATGKKKVQLIGRCLGSTLVSTYLTVYGCSKVDTAIYYAPSSQGVIPLSAFFTGDIQFDKDAIYKYVDNNMLDESSDFVKMILRLLRALYAFDWGVNSVESAYRDIARTLYPRIVLTVYGKCPGFWTMVRDEYYDEAKKVVFQGKKQYSNLIAKIDKYHYNVFNRLETTLKRCQQQGMKLAFITKYNTPMAPLFGNCTKQADNLVELETASFGATCADIGKTLSSSYILKQQLAGKGKYISPDLVIDASTCKFPDQTWFIKDLPHEGVPNNVNELIMEIFRSKEQYKITTNSKYPQFLQYESDSVILSEVTLDKDTSFLHKIANAFNSIFVLIKLLFNIM